MGSPNVYSISGRTSRQHKLGQPWAWLVSNLRNDELNYDGGIGVKVEALEADLFEWSVQMRRLESWTDERT